ncbi:emp24/gp25L/p24 family/GOLD-domain-containing protein [Ochromonadaceae sp. CCMP2298]|nr:emp24/gp25L/p24 family/GOLD-domain-containing protein [Ochromonadaceae sp. CCMP2298]
MHESFNFVLAPMRRQCFFETLTMKSPAHRVEAFVLSGGNRDVLLTFHGPLIESDILKEFFEDPIFHETIDSHKEMDSETLTYTTNFQPEKPGTYAICLDNRNSRFMSKVVQLDVSPVSPLVAVAVEEKEEVKDTDAKAEVDASKLRESLSALNAIHKGLTKIQMQQQRDRHRLDLHSEANNHNYSSVFTGSIFETCCFIVVSIFQIYFVRRWFAAKKPKAKAWA